MSGKLQSTSVSSLLPAPPRRTGNTADFGKIAAMPAHFQAGPERLDAGCHCDLSFVSRSLSLGNVMLKSITGACVRLVAIASTMQ